MKWFAAYDPATGRIVQTGAVPNADIDRPQGPSGTAVYKGEADHRWHYIDPDTGERKDKEAFPYLLSISTGQAVITTLPQPCKLRILDEDHTITDGVATLNFDAPGTYAVELSAEPRYFPETLELEIP